ncbi:MAG: hypothetical protein LR017_02800 [Candidatus Pacebacteria bacterium]|nr:hypothetical protein [Candidatus Paceibacterota bacterium]
MITVWIEYPESYAARITDVFKRDLKDVIQRHIDISHKGENIRIQTLKCALGAFNTTTSIDIVFPVDILPQASDELVEDVQSIAGEHVVVKVYVHTHET